MIRDGAGIAALLEGTAALRRPLAALAGLGLPDAWIGAGFLRNAVWDALCGLPFGSNPPGDVDAVWFDPARLDPAEDAAIEARLHAACPGLPWSVRNQARMAARNGDAPYASTLDAVAHWPETATAIAARLGPAGVEVAAPWGFGDLLGRVIRPTPGFAADPAKCAVFEHRLAVKGWTRRWPGMVVRRDPPPPAVQSRAGSDRR